MKIPRAPSKMSRILNTRMLIVFLLIFCGLGVMQLFLSSINTEQYSSEITACQSIEKIISTLTRRVKDGSTEIRFLLEKLNGSHKDSNSTLQQVKSGNPIGSSHEVLLQRAMNYVREIGYVLAAQSADGQTSSVQLLDELTRLLQVDLMGLGRVDGLAQNRISELDRLSRLVHQRIDKIQNPKNCSQAKFLIADLNQACGFGCRVHHLAYCFQLAYFSGRTLLLSSSEATNGWWAKTFQPLSDRCSTADWSNNILPLKPAFKNEFSTDDSKVLKCPYIDMFSEFKWLPPAVPADLATDLSRVHGYPFVWFIGQLMAYLMRPSASFEALLNVTLKDYNMLGSTRSPIVGVHIRRSDKIPAEAQYHDIGEYMNYVDKQFKLWDTQKLMMSRSHEWQHDVLSSRILSNSLSRQVFLATDDRSVATSLASRFPNYKFHFDLDRVRSADVVSRLSFDSTTGIALDMFLLSRTDYLVCTFSSQVCRVAYELMQTRHAELGDASALAQSLDDSYYFGGHQSDPQEAILADLPSSIRPGDEVFVAGNHWNGYAMVHSPHSPRHLAPAYKFRPRVLEVPVN